MSDYNPNNIDVYQTRELDWRNGAIVYQVIVDLFAPSLDLESKKDLYSAPRILKSWHESPKAGEYIKELKVYS